MTETTKSFRQLEVWQRSIDLVDIIYVLTKDFPKEEMFGLSQQLRRVAVSISSNIAEGSTRKSRKEFQQFLSIARGSLAEVETQIVIATRRKYITDTQHNAAIELIHRIDKMLYRLAETMNTPQRSTINDKRSTAKEYA